MKSFISYITSDFDAHNQIEIYFMEVFIFVEGFFLLFLFPKFIPFELPDAAFSPSLSDSSAVGWRALEGGAELLSSAPPGQLHHSLTL